MDNLGFLIVDKNERNTEGMKFDGINGILPADAKKKTFV